MEQERQLVARVNAGDRGAFRDLITRYERLVCHVVFRMVQDAGDREELCQDVFVRVHRNLATYRFESRLSTWIARIAYNTVLNHLEKKRIPLYEDLDVDDAGRGAMDRAAFDAPNPADDAAAGELKEFVRARVEELPPLFRTAITLYHLDDMSVGDIAVVMGIPAGTVKSYLFRARSLLKEQLLARYDVGELQP
jgi:RNA polymerase sigma factor (sigma-70 family)